MVSRHCVLAGVKLCCMALPTMICAALDDRSIVGSMYGSKGMQNFGLVSLNRHAVFIHSLRYSGCLVWNSLPEEVNNPRLLTLFITDV